MMSIGYQCNIIHISHWHYWHCLRQNVTPDFGKKQVPCSQISNDRAVPMQYPCDITDLWHWYRRPFRLFGAILRTFDEYDILSISTQYRSDGFDITVKMNSATSFCEKNRYLFFRYLVSEWYQYDSSVMSHEYCIDSFVIFVFFLFFWGENREKYHYNIALISLW